MTTRFPAEERHLSAGASGARQAAFVNMKVNRFMGTFPFHSLALAGANVRPALQDLNALWILSARFFACGRRVTYFSSSSSCLFHLARNPPHHFISRRICPKTSRFPSEDASLPAEPGRPRVPVCTAMSAFCAVLKRAIFRAS